MDASAEKTEKDPDNPETTKREVRGWYAYEIAESAFQCK